MTPRLRRLRARARNLLRQWDRALVRALRVACAQRPVPERLARRWQRRYERADAAWRAARPVFVNPAPGVYTTGEAWVFPTRCMKCGAHVSAGCEHTWRAAR